MLKGALMNLKKFISLFTATLTLCLLLVVPLSASAATENYVSFSEHDIYIYIPAGSKSAQASIHYRTNLSSGLLTWYSSDSSVVRVNKDGTLTGLKSGSAVVTASFINAKDSCTVTVYKEKVSILNYKSATLHIQYNNAHPTTKLYLTEVGAFDGIRRWDTSNPAVATVDNTGLVTAQAPGTATIYAYTTLGNTLSCTITVVNDIGKISLNQSEIRLEAIGGQTALVASVGLEDPSSVSITWTSSNPAVATVDAAGLVTAVGDGEATITATGSNGRSASCTVLAGSAAKKDAFEEWLDEWF